MRRFSLIAAMVLVAVTGYSQKTDDKATSAAQTAAKVEKLNNKYCPVMTKEEIHNDKFQVITHNGYEVRLCCKKCLKKFKENPDEFLKKAQSGEKAAVPTKDAEKKG